MSVWDDLATCPECWAGKHGNCDGVALDQETDRETECRCDARDHEPDDGGMPALTSDHAW